MPVQNADPAKRGFSNMKAIDKCRLVNHETGMFLHFTGQNETKVLHYAWLGHGTQAKLLKEQAEARGDPWPYTLVHRAVFEPTIIPKSIPA